MIKGTVVLVGRPNVGKSTLFNRLTKSRQAIVDDRPGVTRDRIYGVVKHTQELDSWSGYMVIDTGGFEKDDFKFQPFTDNIVWQQTQAAIENADVVMLVLDGREGPTPHDKKLVDDLRRLQKTVLYVINKIDGIEKKHESWPFFELGVDDFITISAAHNRGVYELCEKIEDMLANCNHLTKQKQSDDYRRIAIIGSPNVGKSSLLNRLAGEERAIVSDIPGTTRDAVDIQIQYNQKSYMVIDTAGIRRKTKIHDKVEAYSVIRSLKGIEQADIVLLVIGPDGLHDQEARLAALALSKFKPLLIIVNKWDLVENKDQSTAENLRLDILGKIGNHSYVPVIFVSCLQNQRVHKIMSYVEDLLEDYQRRIPTAQVNEVLQAIVHQHTPALDRNSTKRVKFYYGTQVKTCPPTIVVKCNVSELIQESYKRYMNNQFRARLGYGQTPIRLLFREKSTKEKQRPT